MVVGFTTTLYNQCLSPPMLWVRIPLRQGVLDTTLCDKVCQWVAAGRWFFWVHRFTPSMYVNDNFYQFSMSIRWWPETKIRYSTKSNVSTFILWLSKRLGLGIWCLTPLSTQTLSYDINYTEECEPTLWLWCPLHTGRRTQPLFLESITPSKVNPIHGYDSHYPLEGEPNPWLC
jgi:hypothetical protein